LHRLEHSPFRLGRSIRVESRQDSLARPDPRCAGASHASTLSCVDVTLATYRLADGWRKRIGLWEDEVRARKSEIGRGAGSARRLSRAARAPRGLARPRPGARPARPAQPAPRRQRRGPWPDPGDRRAVVRRRPPALRGASPAERPGQTAEATRAP
jgi:hypothetical protein